MSSVSFGATAPASLSTAAGRYLQFAPEGSGHWTLDLQQQPVGALGIRQRPLRPALAANPQGSLLAVTRGVPPHFARQALRLFPEELIIPVLMEQPAVRIGSAPRS